MRTSQRLLNSSEPWPYLYQTLVSPGAHQTNPTTRHFTNLRFALTLVCPCDCSFATLLPSHAHTRPGSSRRARLIVCSVESPPRAGQHNTRRPPMHMSSLSRTGSECAPAHTQILCAGLWEARQ